MSCSDSEDECAGQKFPITDALDISQGEIELLTEKIELLLQQNNVHQKNLINSTLNEKTLLDTVSKLNSENNALQSSLKEAAGKFVVLKKVNTEMKSLVKSEHKRSRSKQRTIDLQQKTISKLRKQMKTMREYEKSREDESVASKILEESQAGKIKELMARLTVQDVEIAAQSAALTKGSTREADTLEQLRELISIVPNSDHSHRDDNAPSVSHSNSFNCSDVIVDLRVAISKLLEDNDKMSLNDAVLRTEIDKLKCVLREVCSQQGQQKTRSANLLCFQVNSSNGSEYSKINPNLSSISSNKPDK